MRSSFLTLKIIAIVILVAIFWIGLFFISSLVSERQGYQKAFLQEMPFYLLYLCRAYFLREAS